MTAMEKASKIISERSAFGGSENLHCVLAQEDTDGRLTASVITPAKADGIRQITFCTGLNANTSNRARRDPRAAVCFSSDTYSITLRGSLEIVTDTAVKQENWYSGLDHHFSGADDPNYCVLRFTTERYKLFVDWEETEDSL